MAAGTQSDAEPVSDGDPSYCPEIAACESCPGTTVFLESDNTDGWIASDTTVTVRR